MTLQEMLSTPEAKKMYRELSMKYHPDVKGGNLETMKRINAIKNAREVTDKEMKELYSELEEKKTKKKKSSYDDTKKQSSASFDYQDAANETLHIMRDIFRKNIDKKANFFGFIRKHSNSNKRDFSATYTILGESGSFFVLNIDQYRTKLSFADAINNAFNKQYPW